MFSKLAIIASLVAFVAATPVPGGSSQCNTGTLQCCDQVHQRQDASYSLLASLVGLNVQDITADIGTQCSPITALGLGSGAQCSQQPVCCSGNNFSGLIVIGCSPVNV